MYDDILYISGPITGHDIDERKKVFADAARLIKENGYKYRNPLGGNVKLGLDHREYMRKDLLTMLRCTGIVQLDNWNESEGCRVEYEVAIACGLTINSIHDFESKEQDTE